MTQLAKITVDFHRVQEKLTDKMVLDWDCREDDIIFISEITDYKDSGKVNVSFSADNKELKTKTYSSEQSAYDSSLDDIVEFMNEYL